MVDRTISVRLRAEVADFKRGMADAAKVVDKNAASIDTLSNHVGLLGGALTGFAALAVARFAQFDKQMSSVQAATRASGAELDSLRQAAIRAGADTAFSATEAAAGIEELAKAGVSTADILGGGLTGALNLAAAGEIEVADAAQIAAVTLKQFNLAGSDVSHIADLLSAGAGKAVGSVSDLSSALNQAGLIASQTGLSVEETTAGLSAFAAAGLLGSDAGTSFKTMLQVLSAPSTTAAAEMERLGINAYDAQGNFIGLEGVAGNLRSSLAGLTDEQKSSALATIFGSDAVRAASVLYKEGALGIQQWTDAVNQQGYAAEQARIQNDNLLGDLERLGGSLDSVLIQAGSGANDSLRLIVQAAEAAVNALGQIPTPVLQATTAIAGAGGLALLGVAGLGKLAVSVAEVRSALASMNLTLGQGVKAAAGFGVVLAGVGVGLAIMGQRAAESEGRVQQLAQTWDDAGRATTATNNLITESLTKQTDNLADGGRTLIELADQVGVSTQDLIGYIEGEEDAIGRVNAAIEEHSAYNDAWLTKTFGQQTEAQNLSKELDTLSGEYQRSKEVSDLDARAKEAAADATAGATGATEELTGALQENSEALDENWQAQLDASGAVLELRDAESQAEAAYDAATAALKDNGKTLDVATEKGRANRSALDQIASSGFDLVDSLRASGASLKDVQGAMATARERFIATAQSMGMGERAANRLADQLGLIPRNVTTTATVNTGAALSQIATLDNTLNRINGKVVRASVVVKQYGQAAMAEGGSAELAGRATGQITGGIAGRDSVNALLMPGEHVLTTSDVQKMGGQAGVYGFRAALQAGLMRFASGGAVGQAENELQRAQRLSLNARRALADARRDERRARSESAQRAAERRVERAETLLRERQAAVNEARDKVARLREQASEVRTDLRRGNISDSVTGGLSGALGVTDQLRDLAASGDVSRFGSRRLNNVAGSAEKALTSLYKQAERIDKRIESATNRFEKWKAIADSVSSSISGGFSLGGVSGGVNPWSGKEQQATGGQLLAASLAYQEKARKLVVKLRALQEAGYGTAILQEVAGQGVDGGVAMADALLSLSPKDRKALIASQRAIDFYAGRAGIAATDDAVTSAARALEAAQALAAAIDKNIGRYAKILGAEMARALGIRARASGGPTMAGSAYLVGENGPELHVPSRSGYVLNANRTAAALSAGPQKVVYVTVTQNYPQAIPYSKAVNNALQHAAEGIV